MTPPSPKQSKGACPPLEWYRGKTILVTGANGYLGTNLVAQLTKVPCHIVRLVHRQRSALPTNKNITDIRGDIREASVWAKALKGVDIVFHLAAQTSASAADKNPSKDYAINVSPIQNLIKTCRQKKWHPTVVFAATVTQTGLPKKLPVNENHPDAPVDFHDFHKLLAEEALLHATQEGILSGTSLRFSNIYGPGPCSGQKDRGILNRMILRAVEGNPISYYGRGREIRDYLFIDDAINAFLLAGSKIPTTRGRFFVIGSGRGYSLRRAFTLVADRVHLLMSQKVAVGSVKPPARQPLIEFRNFVADSCLFKKTTGWRPKYTFREGIDRTINGARSHQFWTKA